MTDEMKKLIEKAAEALKKAGAREVYLFGSQAKDNIHEVPYRFSGIRFAAR